MNEALFVPLAFFAMVVALVWLGTRAKSDERARVHETLRRAFDSGQPLPPEIVGALAQEKPRSTPERDLRSGVIWLAVGVGLAFFAIMMGFEEDDAVYPLIGMASIPVLVGLALIGLGVIGRDKAR